MSNAFSLSFGHQQFWTVWLAFEEGCTLLLGKTVSTQMMWFCLCLSDRGRAGCLKIERLLVAKGLALF
jgi:hypothetical protein